MSGLLREEDVALVKEKTSLEDIVREHVTLTRAGIGSLKGLCPFHDERTPSFYVRPAQGHWHCFGCGEGGDVIAFVQQIEQLGFVEAVQRLADRAGVELRRDESARDEAARGRRTRLLEAHRAAAEFYAEALLRAPEARAGRDFLRQRGFDSAAAIRFGVGYAPRGPAALTRHLLARGFEPADLTAGGLASSGERGLYDRFRGRLMWPVRDVTGATVGFGARRLLEDDPIQAKYLNTSETPIYKKTHLLYGLDLAKKQIAAERTAVVVEGYTDVMAMHLAGVTTAVATCGTAFGPEHVKVLRRLLRDDGSARIVFTFDGDAAGQKAALRAFELDGQWASQSYVAVAADGADPCDLRLSSGDAALRMLVEKPVPIFEFAARARLAGFDLDTAEGQAGAIREVAPILAGIRDDTLLPLYLRQASGWLGVDIDLLAGAVSRARRAPRAGPGPGGASRSRPGGPPQGGMRPAAPGQPGPGEAGYAPGGMAEAAGARGDAAGPPVAYGRPDLSDRVVHLEYQLLQVLVQYPAAFSDEDVRILASATFTDPGLAAVLHAVLTHWGEHTSVPPAAWAGLIRQEAGDPALRLISELSVSGIPARMSPGSGLPDPRYVASLVGAVHEVTLRARIARAAGALRRAESTDPERARVVARELTELHSALAAVREEMG